MEATVAAAGWGVSVTRATTSSTSSCVSAVVGDRGTTHCSCSYNAGGSDGIRQFSVASIQSSLGYSGSFSSTKIVGGRECSRGFGSSGLSGNQQPIWRLRSWKGVAASSIIVSSSSSTTARAAVATGTDAPQQITGAILISSACLLRLPD